MLGVVSLWSKYTLKIIKARLTLSWVLLKRQLHQATRLELIKSADNFYKASWDRRVHQLVWLRRGLMNTKGLKNTQATSLLNWSTYLTPTEWFYVWHQRGHSWDRRSHLPVAWPSSPGRPLGQPGPPAPDWEAHLKHQAKVNKVTKFLNHQWMNGRC